MPLFTEMRAGANLPAVGVGRETLAFDMKGQDGGVDAFERAKDVAAFANASGGVVLVGAFEDAANARLGRYAPIPQRRAAEIKEAYEHAVAERCFPKPVIDPAIIAKDAGFVVAINVWPFAGHAVGVAVRGDPADGYGDRSYVFPVRLATQTIFLTPEQLPMFMLPELRRIAILLDPIRPGDAVVVTTSSLSEAEFVMREFRPLENLLLLGRNERQWTMMLPMDAVRSVWREEPQRWHVVIQGRIYSPSEKTAVPKYQPEKTSA